MPSHPNFYESLEEARMRLRGTVVTYEGEPYYVIEICNHKQDGKFRIYLDSLARIKSARATYVDFPSVSDLPHSAVGPCLDEWIDKNPDKGVLRKYMSAAGFNKYRPFPLGNVNQNGGVVYVERTPTRHTFQGLKLDALICMPVTPVPDRAPMMGKKKSYFDSYTEGKAVGMDFYSDGFYEMITGQYPTAEEVVKNLKDPDVINVGVAFNREFSIFRGPLSMLFLCHQHQGVALLPNKDLSEVKLGRQYDYLMEQIHDLNVFNKITVE